MSNVEFEVLPEVVGKKYRINRFEIFDSGAAASNPLIFFTNGKHNAGVNFLTDTKFASKFLKVIPIASRISVYIPGNIMAHPLYCDSLVLTTATQSTILISIDFDMLNESEYKQRFS
jgi:hypothetical protein